MSVANPARPLTRRRAGFLARTPLIRPLLGPQPAILPTNRGQTPASPGALSFSDAPVAAVARQVRVDPVYLSETPFLPSPPPSQGGGQGGGFRDRHCPYQHLTLPRGSSAAAQT